MPLPPSKRADYQAAIKLLAKWARETWDAMPAEKKARYQSNTETMDREAETPVAIMPETITR